MPVYRSDVRFRVRREAFRRAALPRNGVVVLKQVLSPHVTEVAKKSVPSWVYDLPPDQQAQKIAYVHQYGSPNVFVAFSPHVTLAYDDDTEDLAYDAGGNPADSIFGGAVADAAERWTEIRSEIMTVGFGHVGPAGTVMQGPVVLESISILSSDEVDSL